jgi:hypothetical protein
MYNISYDIRLNELGRPHIELPKDASMNPEDKFYAMELTRTILEEVFNKRSSEFDKQTADNLKTAITVLYQISDNFAEILWEQMRTLGEAAFIIYDKYHFEVETIEDRDKLTEVDLIYYDNKLFEKQNGLKIFVKSEKKIYELVDYDVNSWVEVKKL